MTHSRARRLMRDRTDLSDTTLILVRHAVHGLLGRVLAGRMAGVGLSAEGHAQAAALADALAGQAIRALWTSPLQRAIETAAPIAARHGLVPVIDPALTEVDFGTWTGQPFDALHGPEWEAWNTNRAMAVPPGGETILAAQARAVAVMLRVAGGGGTVVVVSHQDVLKAMLAHVLGTPLDLMRRFDVAPASRSLITMGAGWARVDGLNVLCP